MKFQRNFLAGILSIIMASSIFVGCGKDEPSSTSAELNVGSDELLFSGESTSTQNVNIICNNEWSAVANESWVDISPKKGNGNGTLSITVNSENSSSNERVAVVTVMSGELQREITVKQKATLVADCVVSPTDIVSLYNQFAFDVNWGRKASYFQFIFIEEKDAKRMTDAEIVRLIETTDRYVEKDSYFYYGLTVDGENFLSQNTEYIIYTLAHDENGKAGDLVKTTVKTGSNSNQAAAYISNLRWDSPYWKYTTTINPYASEYYDISWSGTTMESALIGYPDITFAFFLNKEIKETPQYFTPAIQSGDWILTPARTPYILIATWAKDKDGKWSGIVDYDWANMDWYSSSSSDNISKVNRNIKLENGRCRVPENMDFKIRRHAF